MIDTAASVIESTHAQYSSELPFSICIHHPFPLITLHLTFPLSMGVCGNQLVGMNECLRTIGRFLYRKFLHYVMHAMFNLLVPESDYVQRFSQQYEQ